MTKPRLSVIIPNYNNGKYLIQCVKSIESQNYSPLEIVIVDDKSTDNSVIIIKELEEKNNNIKAIFLKENKGVSNARNVGAKSAEGEFITFVDADDFYYSSQKLEREMGIMLSAKNKEVIAYSAVVRVDLDGVIYDKSKLNRAYHLYGNIFNGLITRFNSGELPRDYCMRKETFFKVGGYSYPRNLYEDLDLLIRLSKKCVFVYSENYGTAYRNTPGGLSKKSTSEQARAVREVISQYTNNFSMFKNIYLKIWLFSKKLKRRMFIILSGDR